MLYYYANFSELTVCGILTVMSGMVTRCPLELRMKNMPAGTPWHARITYTIPSTGTGRPVVYDIDDSSDVCTRIQEGVFTVNHGCYIVLVQYYVM